jgi:hypothetical protein
VSHRDWLEWAQHNDIHPLVLEYVQLRPDQLWSQPPKHEEPFSTPRSWHMLSDALAAYGEPISDEWLGTLAYGCLSPPHAGQFKAFVKQVRRKYHLTAILKGDAGWPSKPEDRDVLYFLSQSFRAHLLKELPAETASRSDSHRQLAHRAKGLMKELATISLEMAQMVVAEQDGQVLPGWFMAEIVRDLPRLVEKKHAS